MIDQTDDVCERIGILLSLWRFWTELSSDINDVDVGKIVVNIIVSPDLMLFGST